MRAGIDAAANDGTNVATNVGVKVGVKVGVNGNWAPEHPCCVS
jgi:hypothetical protein